MTWVCGNASGGFWFRKISTVATLLVFGTSLFTVKSKEADGVSSGRFKNSPSTGVNVPVAVLKSGGFTVRSSKDPASIGETSSRLNVNGSPCASEPDRVISNGKVSRTIIF